MGCYERLAQEKDMAQWRSICRFLFDTICGPLSGSQYPGQGFVSKIDVYNIWNVIDITLIHFSWFRSVA